MHSIGPSRISCRSSNPGGARWTLISLTSIALTVGCSATSNGIGTSPPAVGPCPLVVPVNDTPCNELKVCTFPGSVAFCSGPKGRWRVEEATDAMLPTADSEGETAADSLVDAPPDAANDSPDARVDDSDTPGDSTVDAPTSEADTMSDSATDGPLADAAPDAPGDISEAD